MERLRIGVIFGGRSVEHDVSIVTAHQAMEALEASHDVVPIYITREGRWLTSAGLFDLDVYRDKRWDEVGEEAFIPPVTGSGGLYVPGGRLRGARTIGLDVVVPAVHGTFGEDGTLQGLLELAGIPYAGSGVTGSAVGMDKSVMKAAFKAAGLPVLPHELVDVHELLAEVDAIVTRIEGAIGYPAFVKPAHLGSSVGIGKARDRDELIGALEVARRYDYRLLVEPAAEGCIEVNCSVLGGHGNELQASICEQPLPTEEALSFADKYLREGKSSKGAEGMAAQARRIPAPIGDEITTRVQANAVDAFRAIDAAGVARVDSFVKEASGETWVMEINTVPGSFSFYLWERSGLDFPALLQRLIDIALAGGKERAELMFTFDSGMLERGLKGGKRGG
jgi:D-alanine-D-alanine ligase